MKTMDARRMTQPHRAIARNGSHGKNIIATFVKNGREWQFHATKGWRSRRASK